MSRVQAHLLIMWNSRRWQQLFLITVALLVLCCRGALALTAVQQGNQLFIDGKQTPLLFARHLQDARDLPAYRAMGFNTLLVTIDSPGPGPLAAAEQLMSAAEAQGLYLLVELSNGYWSSEKPADARSAAYRDGAMRFLDKVIPPLAKHRNLVGWVISAVDEEKFACNAPTFTDYLRQKYGGEADVLNAWSVRDDDGNIKYAPAQFSFALFSALPLDSYIKAFSHYKEVADLIRQDYAAYQALCTDREKTFQAYLAHKYYSPGGVAMAWHCADSWAVHDWSDLTQAKVLQHEHDHPGSSPPSLFELAAYQGSFSPVLLDWWASALRLRDPAHLLFAGAQFSYRTLITLPPSLNGVLTECYPGVAEADIDTQNPQAVDIARRGNQFIVLAGLRVQDIAANRLTNAMVTAAVHGAAGLCLTDWPTLNAPADGEVSDGASEAVRSTFAALRKYQLLGMVPASTTAIIYSPYLPGPQGGHAHGLYGYLYPSMLFPSPRLPFATFRDGTGAGQVDYLAVSDLLNPALLNRYAVLILPSVFDLPVNEDPRLDTQQALLSYARQPGHTVLADFGAGTLQANRDFIGLPLTLMQLFNLKNVTKNSGIEFANGNLALSQPFPDRFPSLRPGFRTVGIAKGYVVTRSMPMLPLPRTQLLFEMVKGTGFTPPVIHTPEVLPLKPSRGVFIFHQSMDTLSPAQGGYAIFCPFSLYQSWVSGIDPIFGSFHRDLLAMNARALLTCPTDFFPLLTELATYADGSLVVWTKQQTRPALTLSTPDRRLYLTTTEASGDLGPQCTNFQYNTAGFHLLRPLPLTPLDAAAAPFTYVVTQFTPRALDLSVNGCDDGQPRPLSLLLTNGAYALKPGSLHLATITSASSTQTVTLTAEADPANPKTGRLILPLPAGPCRLQLAPVAIPNDNEVVVKTHRPDDGDVTVDLHKLDNTEPVVKIRPLGGKN